MNAITRKQTLKLYVFTFLLVTIMSCNEHAAKYKTEELTIETVDLRNDYNGIESSPSLKKIEQSHQEQTTGFTSSDKVSVTSNIPENLQIIKTASTRYKVKDISEALIAIKQEMYVQGGYISELRFDKNYQEKKNRFTIKIPKENFDQMLDGIQKFAEETDYVNISTTDVTEKYMDAQTRLQTKLEVKARLEAVLRKNAKTVKDILDTESQLRVLQEEIEAVQGKIKYMSNRVAYSTIQVELYETITYKEKPVTYQKGFGAKAKEGLIAGWQFIQNVIIGMLHIWPFILVVTIAIVVFKRWKKAKK